MSVESCHSQNWKWQLSHQIRQSDQIKDYRPDLSSSLSEAAIESFPLGITPYYLSLVEKADDSDPIWRQIAPHQRETEFNPGELSDPLNEERLSASPRLVHRYKDRALLLVSDICFIYCRHCNRKHFTAQEGRISNEDETDEALSYLEQHQEIREVILSGGDALSLSDQSLSRLCERLRSISHIEIIRIATRAPVVCPMRLTSELADALKKFHPIYIMTHFNHPVEVTELAGRHLEIMADAGFPLMNQMVLLKGINDRPEVVQELNRKLIRHRCRPYYIFMGDPGPGLSEYHADLEAGLEILESMRGYTSGLMIPQFAVDLPGGKGKVTVQPEYLESQDEEFYHFKAPDGTTVSYRKPSLSSKNRPQK